MAASAGRPPSHDGGGYRGHTALAAGETSLVTVTFNEAVTGLSTADFSVANGALSSLSTADGGISWTATLTPSTDTEDTSNLVTLDNSGVADTAGNAGSGSTDSNNYAVDTLRPTASIVVADTALAAGETSLVTVTFNEAVTGLSTADFSVANGALSSLSTADGGITWTATLTPSTDIEDTSNLVSLDNSGVQDLAGNAGSGSTDSNNYAVDTLRPTASIVVADTALAAGETSLVTISFSEAVTGLTTADFSVANGSLSGLATADSGITWTATLTPSIDTEDASNLVSLDNSGVQDLAGNAGSGSTDSNNYAIDTLRPTASIVVADTALAAGETSLVTVTFNEAVTGLTTADFSVANGSLSGLATADGGISWTATLTPTADIEDTSNLVSLDNSGVQDLAGNAGSGSTDSNNYAIDTLRPTASIVVADTALAAGETSLVTISFSEAVTGLTTADFSVANGALSSLSTADGGISWTATLTPTADVEDTSNLVSLDNSGVQDLAGNAGSGSTDSNNYAIDTLAPTVLRIEVPADGALASGELTFELVFDEAVSGVDIGDFSLLSTGNVIASLDSMQQVDASTYRVLVSGVDGNGSLSLVLNAAGSGIVDNAGNALAAGLTGPSVTITTLSGDPQFRLQDLGASPAATLLAMPTPPDAPPAPFDSALMPTQLFNPPGLGSGIPSLSSIFINNGASTPSVISQVFASHTGSNDGSGRGFLGFGGGDASGFGSSTLSNIFNADPMPDMTPELELPAIFGAPTLSQQLQQLQDNEQNPIDALALALTQVQPVEPNA
ncbi:Ig-like domain-containing protein [Marinobacterium rhizophilum]|uniref:Bacterial Ig-like domain-containing protein n=1 Tax=Marinobacterium rhizophilum TaxID=420402 RepID=A0ABY5HL72_9GAMM|nr:Ig-like domain-containing protein [Marinobacterium rhizophilum]UTW13140.1 hypothetical protein KDW95_05615 [Marinobacterium rhizophilum]